MKSKEYFDLKDVIKDKFGGNKYSIQNFADYRGVGRTQVNRWISKKAHLLNGDPNGEVFILATTRKKAG